MQIKEMAKNVAMQVAASESHSTPARAEVSADYIAHEKGDPVWLRSRTIRRSPRSQQKVIEGMINGRINKELKEICLMDQAYVKAEDGKQTVSAVRSSGC